MSQNEGLGWLCPPPSWQEKRGGAVCSEGGDVVLKGGRGGVVRRGGMLFLKGGEGGLFDVVLKGGEVVV